MVYAGKERENRNSNVWLNYFGYHRSDILPNERFRDSLKVEKVSMNGNKKVV